MTRAKFLGALALIAIAVEVIAFIPGSNGNEFQSAKSKIESVGLAEYGLEIIDSGHPAFKRLLSQKQSGLENSFSLFVVNNGDRAIASCTLKWDILMRDGQTVTHFRTKTGSLDVVSDGTGSHLAEGMPAKGKLFFSLTSDSDSHEKPGVAVRSQAGPRSAITDQLSDSTSVKVSIDGVLFVDGTYVGPDVNNYLERFKGQIEAKRELATEIAQLVDNGAKPNALIKHLEKVANTQSDDVRIPPGEDPEYSFGKWVHKSSYARLLLLMQKERGDQAVLERVRAELAKPQIELRRVK